MKLFLLAFLMLLGTPEDDQSQLSQLQQVVQQKTVTAATEPTDKAPSSNSPSDKPKSDEKATPLEPAPAVKGIYVTAHSAGGSRMESLIKLLDETELNAMVIDIKDDWGTVTYHTGNPELEAMGTSEKIIKDMPLLMQTLEKHQIYPIARVVVFKDSTLPKIDKKYTFLQGNQIWKNGRGESFVNPYMKEVWEYNVAVAKEAAKAGFKEIQFDYVRFPEGFEKRADKLSYYKPDISRIDAVTSFVEYAKKELEPLGVRVSVDIFGYAASVPAAEGIGQDFLAISKNVDVICPMIYPSHYGPGWFGKSVPDAHPYNTIHGAIADTLVKLEPLGEEAPIVRAWIQDFTASWVDGHIQYGKKEINAQIKALRDQGLEEYLIWNAKNRYTTGVDF
jgi:hypothetical protein